MTFGVLYMLQKSNVTTLVRQHKKLIIVAGVVLLVLAGAAVSAKDTYFVQNVIFHADESTVLEDPNELRVRFWSESWQSAVTDPLGHGPGTAGLASIRNDVQGTVLNENYYLQILYEVGFVGLLLLLAIIGVVGLLLYNTFRHEKNTVALGVLAALAGLLVTNFLVHIWSNEAVAYTFWALAGLYVVAVKKKK
jgi:O-antigen ligase